MVTQGLIASGKVKKNELAGCGHEHEQSSLDPQYRKGRTNCQGFCRDALLILPWNLKQEIVKQVSYAREWGAKFVVPIPEVRVID